MGINIGVTTHDDSAVLAGLVGDLDAFAEKHWGRRPLFRVAGEEWSRLLSVDDIENLLATGARTPTFRLVRDGERLPVDKSTRPVRIAGQLLHDVADPERIAAALRDGATLVAQGLETTSLKINRICRGLEYTTSHPVQANAYLTPAGAVGLAPHHDEHDVIVVQQSGTKTWSVDGLGDEITLTPGDVLYLPAGTTHSRARADQREPASHDRPTEPHVGRGDARRDRFDRRTESAAAARLRGDATFAAEIESMFHQVRDRLACVNADDVASRESLLARERRRPLLDGHIGDVLRLDAITLDTFVTRRPEQAAHLEDDGTRVEVVLRDTRIGLPALARPALERLLRDEPVRVGDLPGIDDDSKLVVARRMVSAAVVAIAR